MMDQQTKSIIYWMLLVTGIFTKNQPSILYICIQPIKISRSTHSFKTLGTCVIYSPMSPPSLIIQTKWIFHAFWKIMDCSFLALSDHGKKRRCGFRIFTVAFLLFLAHVGGSSPAGQSLTFTYPNATLNNLSKASVKIRQNLQLRILSMTHAIFISITYATLLMDIIVFVNNFLLLF